MLDNLRADTRRLREIKSKPFPFDVLESLLFENGYLAVVLFRISHGFKSRGVPVLGPFFHRLSIFLTGVDIAPAAQIGPGFRISHGVGIVIGNGAHIGSGCLMMQGVTVGAPTQARIDEMPRVGERVILGAGAKLIGKIQIGDDALIGVNTVVTRDVPAGAKVLPPPPRIVEAQTSEDQTSEDQTSEAREQQEPTS